MEKSLIKFNVESFRMAGKNMEQTQHRKSRSNHMIGAVPAVF